MFYDEHFIQTFLIGLLLLTVIPVLQGPAGDDVLHQHGVALHEDHLRHQADGEPLKLPDLHVHRAQLGVVAVRFRLLLRCFCVLCLDT